MRPEEKFNFEIWWVLQELRHKQISASRGGDINFVIEIRPPVGPKNKPSAEAQKNAIIKLEEWKAIQVDSSEAQDDTYGKDVICLLKILPKFTELYELYKNGLDQGIDAERLFKMVNEWAHPNSGDTNLSFEIWQLIKGKILNQTRPETESAEVEYSKENLKRIIKVLEIISDELELVGVNRPIGATKIPLARFRREGFEIEDISRILNSIDKNREAVWVIDVRSQWLNDSFVDDFLATKFITKYGFKITKEESLNTLVLGIKSTDKLEGIKNEFDKKLVAATSTKTNENIIKPTKPELEEKNRPYCEVSNGIGYLKFGKHGEKVKIGKDDCQAFRILSCLTEPFGVAKTVDTVYEAIREGRYGDPRGIYTGSVDKMGKLNTIKNSAIKEAQKGNKLRGKLRFKFNETQSKLWLEYVG